MLRDPWPKGVRFVALCGNPKAGKSQVAEFLVDEFGGAIIDDGLSLRLALPELLGFDHTLPFSQEGKATTIQVGNRTEQVRDGLGSLGDYLENRYGTQVMPERAVQRALAEHPEAPFWIFPSVRKDQARTYKRLGGICIEVDRPGTGPSGYAFDKFEPHLVDFTIHNDGSLEDLRAYIHALPSLIDAL